MSDPSSAFRLIQQRVAKDEAHREKLWRWAGWAIGAAVTAAFLTQFPRELSELSRAVPRSVGAWSALLDPKAPAVKIGALQYFGVLFQIPVWTLSLAWQARSGGQTRRGPWFVFLVICLIATVICAGLDAYLDKSLGKMTESLAVVLAFSSLVTVGPRAWLWLHRRLGQQDPDGSALTYREFTTQFGDRTYSGKWAFDGQTVFVTCADGERSAPAPDWANPRSVAEQLLIAILMDTGRL
jgi:hypothetical protein